MDLALVDTLIRIGFPFVVTLERVFVQTEPEQ